MLMARRLAASRKVGKVGRTLAYSNWWKIPYIINIDAVTGMAVGVRALATGRKVGKVGRTLAYSNGWKIPYIVDISAMAGTVGVRAHHRTVVGVHMEFMSLFMCFPR